MNGRRNVGRVLGHIAVIIVILAVIAAAFAISYDPVRDIARQAGVQSWLIRIYPGVLDAVFLVACACALLLRGARWWNRLYGWLSVLVIGALIGAADVYHATGLSLPRRTMDGTVWALPWALVLLGFSLWLTTLRRSQPAPDTGEAAPADVPPPADAPVLALAGTTATRAALPAPGRTGGLAEVGFGARAAAARKEAAEAAQSEKAPADIEKGAGDVEPRVAVEASEPAEVTAAENAPGPQEPAESEESVVPEEPSEPADSAEAANPAPAQDATKTTPAEDTAEAEKVPPTADADRAADAAEASEVAESGQAAEPEWPFEPEEASGASKTDEAAQPVPASDDDTPPYGFPAVSEHDEAPRMPTLLSAPVPADLETAPAPAGEAGEGEKDRGAKGQPPATAPELPVDEAGLSHEPPTPPAPEAPGEIPPPAHFERIRSTPARPRPGG